MFIKALYNEGAREGALEACVAGGALLGPPSAVDLDLEALLSCQPQPLEAVANTLDPYAEIADETDPEGFCVVSETEREEGTDPAAWQEAGRRGGRTGGLRHG